MNMGVGGVFNGEKGGFQASAQYGMYDDLHTSQDSWTCWQYDGGLFNHKDEQYCRNRFVSEWDGTENDDAVSATLLLQYDGRDLVHQAVGHNWADGNFVFMERVSDLGHTAQPMTTYFSVLAPGGTTFSKDIGMSVDWFLFTDDDTIDVWDARVYADSLIRAGNQRVNSFTSSSMNGEKPSTTTVSGTLAYNANRPSWKEDEVTIILDNTADPEWYQLSWKHRFLKQTTPVSWSAWTVYPDTVGWSLPAPDDFLSKEYVQVQATATQYDDSNKYVVMCGLSEDYGSSFSPSAGTCSNSTILAKGGPLTEPEMTLPSSLSISNYPNPFNPRTLFSIDLPEGGIVNIQLYDLSGRFIETVVNEHMETGIHTVPWSARGIASGTYLYVVRVNDKTLSRKMQLIK